MADRTPLDADLLRARLAPRWVDVQVVGETSSTNADLVAAAAAASDRTVRIAEQQSAGRGRLDRSWSSPKGAGLLFSALLRPDVPLVRWGWLPLLTGVALAEAVESVTGIGVGLKWPNDLLAPDGRKLAGILVQTAEDAAVIGIGLNVSTTVDELPVETGTSLALCGAEPDRADLLIAILERLDARAAQWADCGGDAEACGLAAAYRSVCATLGAQVRVGLAGDLDGGPSGAIVGTALDIDDVGRLVVRTDGGEVVVGAGDVQHVRPA